MTFYTHSTFAVLLSVILMQILNISGLTFISLFGPTSLQFVLGAALGSLVPDLDQRNIKLSRKIPLLSWILKFLGIKHRGISHSILGIMITALFSLSLIRLKFINMVLVYGFLIGYLSHILMDLFNPGGVTLFWPKNKRYSLGNIKVGKVAENLLFLVISSMLVLMIYWKDGTLNLISDLIYSLRSGFN
ncbi:inner membrane protein [Candidatus Frackibacter sp. WG11]|uniref:metal-dependent hydrolase n=1 Tax=Candidatus Frackibacter sp. WG11 TaxID=2017976 RepID=UPI0008859010|nr:metal-dependent hydrolase [Candidatus Frackibacter sp. WG11]SDC31026.1 inner membrane protein [Candidatus Frackibacter sp. WG11]